MIKRRAVLASGAYGVLAASGLSRATAATGFRVPAEEALHERTFMQWPVSPAVYRDQIFLQMVQQTIADVANAISEFEPVTMLAAREYHAMARRMLSASVDLLDVPTEDLWCRDAGPIVAINETGQRAVVQIQFNGWGRKQVHHHDSQVARRVAEHFSLPLLPTGLHGEAGGVDQDGHGLLIAHESSWLTESRNPAMDRDEVAQRLLEAYGADRIIWSDGVWGEDITDYHIDSLARFTGPGRVLINLPDDPDMTDPFHLAALDTHDRLVEAGLDVEVIPEPTIRRIDAFDFVASYANYYVCNGAVIAAQFGDVETDRIAQDALARHYPSREIISLNVDPLGELGGGIHCATQQMPAV
ncbi:agmatine deiminase family protein [Pontivivens insulae]|uniref:Agmatine deiminase n=1 Tax=Pontivivens insulae TaxID=1639689 RepID=A0A2R8AFN7_9RHOB|nr:agmatine deiminase family protein [Pontivivens insulae]RED12297.1 agmatine deiminase [Pontivivens insulae]SPF31054.1 Putative agmatine deiminase [Pontivivens insulae]